MEYIYGKEIQSITNHLSNNQGYDLTVTDERDLEMLSLLARLTPEQKEMLLLQIKGLLPPQE